MRRLGNFLRRKRGRSRAEELHAEIAAELEFHLEQKALDLAARGLGPEEAQATAARNFGHRWRIHEAGYDVRGGRLFEGLRNDFLYALRLLGKAPQRTAVLVLTLALGLGFNTAAFSVVKAVLLNPLPFAAGAQLVTLHQSGKGEAGGVSYPNFLDWRAQCRSFSSLAVYLSTASTLTGDGPAERRNGAVVSASLFPLLGVRPLLGRLFAPAEDRLGSGENGARPVLISDRLWRSRWAESPGVLGNRLALNGLPYRVVGVIPSALAFPVQNEPLDYWVTVAADAEPTLYGGTIPISRGYPRYDGVLARLKPGVTLPQAQAELALIAQHIAREYPKTTSLEQIRATPALADIVGDVRPLILLVYAAVGCVLLVAFINAATLLLAGSHERAREFSLRFALGAKRLPIVRQILVETSLTAALGGCAGWLVGWLVLKLFIRLAPASTPRLAAIQLDSSILIYLFATAVLLGILLGVAPAVAAARVDLIGALKEGGRTTTRGPGGASSGSLLICGQIALSMLLTACASVLVSSFAQLLNAPRGFDPRGVLTMRIDLPASAYPQGSPKITTFYNTLLARVRDLSGVTDGSVAEVLPLSNESNSTTVQVNGRPEPDMPSTGLRFVDANYFQTLHIPLVAGRGFNERDTPASPGCVIVNRAFVHRFLTGRDPLASTVRLGWGGDDSKHIVGVVADIRHRAVSPEVGPEVYVPAPQFPLSDMVLLIRTTNSRQSTAALLRQQVQRLDPGVPVGELLSLEEYRLLAAAPQRFLMCVLVLFAGASLLLAAIGMYGVLSYATSRRTHEFGIRLALGSRTSGLVRLVFGQAIRITLTGIAIGLVLSLYSGRLLASWLYATSPTDVASLTGAAACLLAVGCVAAWAPARRAISVDPIRSLRSE